MRPHTPSAGSRSAKIHGVDMTNKNRLVILGAGGNGRIVAAAAAAEAQFAVDGFLDDGMAPGQTVNGLPVLGGLADWSTLPDDTVFIPAIQKTGDMQARSALVKSLGIARQRWVSVCHPQSFIGPDVTLGCGVFVASFVTIQPGARIGDFAAIRPGAHISHDTRIGDFAFISPNASLAGGSSVGTCAHIGQNACVRDGLAIGDFAIVGIGAAVVRAVEPHAVVGGNPARPLPGR